MVRGGAASWQRRALGGPARLHELRRVCVVCRRVSRRRSARLTSESAGGTAPGRATSQLGSSPCLDLADAVLSAADSATTSWVGTKGFAINEL